MGSSEMEIHGWKSHDASHMTGTGGGRVIPSFGEERVPRFKSTLEEPLIWVTGQEGGEDKGKQRSLCWQGCETHLC